MLFYLFVYLFICYLLFIIYLLPLHQPMQFAVRISDLLGRPPLFHRPCPCALTPSFPPILPPPPLTRTQLMHQAHRVLLAQAQVLRSWFPPGDNAGEWVHG